MTKLQVLKNYLAYVIENEDSHNWSNPDTCHCGMLLKSTNLYKKELVDQIDHFITNRNLVLDGYYKVIFELYKNQTCEVTNLGFTTVVNELIYKGFTLEELINLEYLADKRFNKTVNYHYESEELILYLTNWIKHEEQISVKQSTNSTVTVSV